MRSRSGAAPTTLLPSSGIRRVLEVRIELPTRPTVGGLCRSAVWTSPPIVRPFDDTRALSSYASKTSSASLQLASDVCLLEIPDGRSLASLKQVLDLVNVRIRRHVDAKQPLCCAFQGTSEVLKRNPKLAESHEGFILGYENPICGVPSALHHRSHQFLSAHGWCFNHVLIADALCVERHVLNGVSIPPRERAHNVSLA